MSDDSIISSLRQGSMKDWSEKLKTAVLKIQKHILNDHHDDDESDVTFEFNPG